VRLFVESSARVQLNQIGDPAESGRCLDAMEQSSGLRGEPNSQGRLYIFESANLDAATNQILDHLPEGWQDHLVFEV
jgi:hypothetical protein